MESFVYKCPSCGGKVEYLNDHWFCSYCGGNYSSLFPSNELELPNLDTHKYKLYRYVCSKCNKTTVSENKKDEFCATCGTKFTEEGKPFIASKVIYKDISLPKAQDYYEEELDKTSYFPSKEAYKKNLELQYFNCDLYKGCIKLSYKRHSAKYVFVNLLVPNIKYEDYKFMYEIGNNGISNSNILKESNDMIKALITGSSCINNFEDKQIEDEIVNQCIKSFKKDYGIDDNKSIKIEKEFEVIDGVFVPIYTCDVEVDNKVYHQYVFGNSNICRFMDGIIAKNVINHVILELPTNKGALFKMRFYRFLRMILPKLIVVCFALTLFGYLPFAITGRLKLGKSVSTISAIVLLLFVLLNYIAYKKSDFYEKSLQISKDFYYSQIINNSNFVKVIRRIK